MDIFSLFSFGLNIASSLGESQAQRDMAAAEAESLRKSIAALRKQKIALSSAYDTLGDTLRDKYGNKIRQTGRTADYNIGASGLEYSTANVLKEQSINDVLLSQKSDLDALAKGKMTALGNIDTSIISQEGQLKAADMAANYKSFGDKMFGWLL